MLILDTNHLSQIDRETAAGKRLVEKLQHHLEETYITIVSSEELIGGWLSLLRSAKSEGTRIYAYSQFGRCLRAQNDWTVLSWDDDTAARFAELRQQGIRIGTLDLRIASIALAYDAVLLSQNLRDFRLVPGLKVENWID